MTDSEPRTSHAVANARVVLVGLLLGVPLGLAFTMVMSKASIAMGFGIGIGLTAALALDLWRQGRKSNR